MPTLESVRKEAMSLTSEEREMLAVDLALSIEKAPGYDEAWAAELERRWAAIQSGEDELLDDDEADAIMFGDDE
ncbi:MAG: addiction module protein [Dehalococcoidia bacterium]